LPLEVFSQRNFVEDFIQLKLTFIPKQLAQLSQRDRATHLSAAVQLHEKSHLTRRMALSCDIKIPPVDSLD